METTSEAGAPPAMDKQSQEAAAAPTASSTTSPTSLDILKRKKYLTSDLPLTQDQQTAVQNLLVAFKKKGAFDSYRKKIWAEFDESVCCSFTAYSRPTFFPIGALRVRTRTHLLLRLGGNDGLTSNTGT